MNASPFLTRRDLLALIGKTAGAGAMYAAMTSLGFAKPSTFTGELDLSNAPNGSSVLVLGAGLGGMTAAYELRKAGYDVSILEYNERPGGRCFTIHSGDTVTDLSGETQHCNFAEGNYINPGPWRIPYHHYGVLHYCKKFGVKLEPFIELNFNAYVHAQNAFGGKPKRVREALTDVHGYTSELLAKATDQGALDELLTQEDKDTLLDQLDSWGRLTGNHQYQRSLKASRFRGYDDWPAGGLMPKPTPSDPLDFKELLHSGLWSKLLDYFNSEYQHTIFEPTGGMEEIARGFAKEVGDMIEYRRKVTRIEQSDSGVTVHYIDPDHPNNVMTRTADWCVCNIPLSILSQIPVDATPAMRQAIAAVPYASSTKTGLEFKRRFWEQDENIFGGVTYTDLPITTISYPAYDYFSDGPGVLLGAYTIDDATSYTMSAMSARERVAAAVAYGKQIHPQYEEEFLSGVSWSWHRSPWSLGCYGLWTEELRAAHYDTLCSIDNRLVLAGEHCSYIPAWMEGAILSGMDASKRLHEKATAMASA
nr:flavin monoamine oxidase family protein [uncultured Halomonas sp.]